MIHQYLHQNHSTIVQGENSVLDGENSTKVQFQTILVQVVKGEGMPITKQPGARGDLRIQFEVEYPRNLTDQQKSQLQDILTP